LILRKYSRFSSFSDYLVKYWEIFTFDSLPPSKQVLTTSTFSGKIWTLSVKKVVKNIDFSIQGIQDFQTK